MCRSVSVSLCATVVRNILAMSFPIEDSVFIVEYYFSSHSHTTVQQCLGSISGCPSIIKIVRGGVYTLTESVFYGSVAGLFCPIENVVGYVFAVAWGIL